MKVWKLVTTVSVLCSFLLSSQLFSFIYEVKVLRTKDARGDYRCVIGLSDFHDKQHPSNGEQQRGVADLLAGCDREKTKIILEDLSSKGCGGKDSCGTYYVDSRGGILGGLAQWAAEKGFEVDNSEFRYCRVASLGPVLNDSISDPRAHRSVNGITVADLLNEIDAVTSSVSSYKDGGRALELASVQVIDEVKQELKKLDMPDNTALSVAAYLNKKAKQSERLELVKKLLTFDSGLLDLLLVRSAINTDKKQVLIVAGGAHIDRITELLKKSGYESVYETDVAYTDEYDLDRCLGSQVIEGDHCVHPQPIDLSVVEKYLR